MSNLPFQYPSKASLVPEVKTLLETLMPIAGEFYSYGSLSRDCEEAVYSDKTDFDFAVEYKSSTMDLFYRQGWYAKDQLSYQDNSTVLVFEKVVRGLPMQVSLKHNLQNFKKVWDSISAKDYWTYINKRSPRAFTPTQIAGFLSLNYTNSQFGRPLLTPADLERVVFNGGTTASHSLKPLMGIQPAGFFEGFASGSRHWRAYPTLAAQEREV